MGRAGKARARAPGRQLTPRRTSVDGPAAKRNGKHLYDPLPALQLIYDTAPVGLAFLATDCRYLQINQRLTEICGISVADHIGRSVRETVPQVADDVERVVGPSSAPASR